MIEGKASHNKKKRLVPIKDVIAEKDSSFNSDNCNFKDDLTEERFAKLWHG